MRLDKVEKGHRLKYRLVLGAIGVVTGRAPDVIRVMMYRPEFFGRPYGAMLHQALRGESDWTACERELFASFTSSVNACEF